MNRAFTVAAISAVAYAVKIESNLGLETQVVTSIESEKFLALNDYSSFSRSTSTGNAIRAAGVQWTDTDFPADITSLGVVTGVSAAGAAGAQSSAISWKRLSDIYSADKLALFKRNDIFSSAQQGALGDCYFISSMVQFDSRPGALEDLFVTDEVNTATAYTLKFNVGGKDAYVTVDDYVPVTAQGWPSKLLPVYASSMFEGEIWPMIMEKAWAKLVGSYSAMESGNSRWVLGHLTNDPIETIFLRNQGFTASNVKGNELWAKMIDYTTKEYLMFTGSDS